MVDVEIRSLVACCDAASPLVDICREVSLALALEQYASANIGPHLSFSLAAAIMNLIV